MRCVEHYRRPPLVAEFEWWRDREFQLARAQGNDDTLHLPSSSPYRRRYGSWEGGLLHFGFTLDEVALRLVYRAEFTNSDADRYLPEGLPIAELREPTGTLPLAFAQGRQDPCWHHRGAGRLPPARGRHRTFAGLVSKGHRGPPRWTQGLPAGGRAPRAAELGHSTTPGRWFLG
jgi:hypothetical protein